jgi:hypothetical protein
LVQSRYNFIYVLPFINGFLDRIWIQSAYVFSHT